MSDRDLLDRISRESKAHMLKRTPAALLSHHFEELLGDTAFNVFYNAPALIVISALVESQWAIEDCALAAENLMLSATAAGLGTCWIGFAQGWLATPEGKAALELPESYKPVAPIIVGHPKFVPPPVTRNEPRIHWIGVMIPMSDQRVRNVATAFSAGQVSVVACRIPNRLMPHVGNPQ